MDAVGKQARGNHQNVKEHHCRHNDETNEKLGVVLLDRTHDSGGDQANDTARVGDEIADTRQEAYHKRTGHTDKR